MTTTESVRDITTRDAHADFGSTARAIATWMARCEGSWFWRQEHGGGLRSGVGPLGPGVARPCDDGDRALVRGLASPLEPEHDVTIDWGPGPLDITAYAAEHRAIGVLRITERPTVCRRVRGRRGGRTGPSDADSLVVLVAASQRAQVLTHRVALSQLERLLVVLDRPCAPSAPFVCEAEVVENGGAHVGIRRHREPGLACRLRRFVVASADVLEAAIAPAAPPTPIDELAIARRERRDVRRAAAIGPAVEARIASMPLVASELSLEQAPTTGPAEAAADTHRGAVLVTRARPVAHAAVAHAPFAALRVLGALAERVGLCRGAPTAIGRHAPHRVEERPQVRVVAHAQRLAEWPVWIMERSARRFLARRVDPVLEQRRAPIGRDPVIGGEGRTIRDGARDRGKRGRIAAGILRAGAVPRSDSICTQDRGAPEAPREGP